MENIGIKIGSLNTAISLRSDGEIVTQFKRTCIRYPKDTIHNRQLSPIVGEEATPFSDVQFPLNLGLIETDEGIQQTKDILSVFNIHKGGNIIAAAPAVQITEGSERVIQVINEIFEPNTASLYSEGLCSSVCILKSPMKILESTFYCLNLGSSTFEFGCFNEGETSYLSAHAEASGNKVDRSILNKISSSIGEPIISEKEARDIKEQSSLTNPKTFKINGFTRKGIVEKQINEEVLSALKEYIELVVDIADNEIHNVPSDARRMAFRISKDSTKPMPLVISGGMSNIEGLSKLVCDGLSDRLNHKFDFVSPKIGMAHLAPSIGALILAEEITKEEHETI